MYTESRLLDDSTASRINSQPTSSSSIAHKQPSTTLLDLPKQSHSNGSTALHRDIRTQRQRRPISIIASDGDYPPISATAASNGKIGEARSGSSVGFSYSSKGGSFSSVDLSDGSGSASVKSIPAHKSTASLVSNSPLSSKYDLSESDSSKKSSSTFMGSLFHIGRKPKDKYGRDELGHGLQITHGPNMSPSRYKVGPYVGSGGNSDPHLIKARPPAIPSGELPSAARPFRAQPSTNLQSSHHASRASIATATTGQIHPIITGSTPPKQTQVFREEPTNKKFLVLCTMDHEHYILVNITGFLSADHVRKMLLERLQLDLNSAIQIHLTELGELEKGEALNDEDLVNYCMTADNKATLKLFIRTTGVHYKSAPDILMYPNNAVYPQQQRRKISPNNIQQPQQSATVSGNRNEPASYLTIANNAQDFQASHKSSAVPHSTASTKDENLETTRQKSSEPENFKVLQRPAPFIDFNQGRQSPYDIHAPITFTAHRNPPPPPKGALERKPSIAIDNSDSHTRPDKAEEGSQVLNYNAFISPVSLTGQSDGSTINTPISASRVSPMTMAPGLRGPLSATESHQEPTTYRSVSGEKEKSFNVPRKSLTPAANATATESIAQQHQQEAEEKRKQDKESEVEVMTTHNTYDGPSYKTVTNEAFEENDISFADAPNFSSIEDEDSDSDDGLWAKKPPSNIDSLNLGGSASEDNSVPYSLLSGTDISGSGDDAEKNSRQNSGKSNRPVLHVKVGGPEVTANVMSAITERTESSNPESAVRESVSSTSPVSSVGDLPTQQQLRPKRTRDVNQSSTYVANDDGWAVRPPAEVVYENLEKFFPNTDLDKPFIDDSPFYSPASTAVDSVTSVATSSQLTSATSMEDSSDGNELLPKNGLDRVFSFRSSSNGEDRIDVQQKQQSLLPSPSPSPSPSQPSSKKSGTEPRPEFSKNNAITRGTRMKSIRIVAKEANEARKNLQAANSIKSRDSTSRENALLRRKSTKMWGQKVVEVTPGQIRRGKLSLQRQGKTHQFNWIKGELIGKGTFGRVYLAFNATTGEMIAVKQVDMPQTAGDKDSVQQREVVEALNAEIETMKDLEHLNIVQYLGYETLPDVCSLFLEYVPGGSIGTVLRKHGRFERPVIRSITRQVVDGLAYLHSKGILHRDLKSDNLLLDLDGICKISDFGISKRSQDIYSNDAGMSMQGTIFWMAPEVIHNVVRNEKQGYSAKVDIWSLGCVVLEMFAGRRPWSNDEAIGAMYKLGNAKLAPPIPEDTVEYIDNEGKEFLDLCFMIDPEKRPTAQVLLNETRFCVPDPAFNFADTRQAKLIKFNDKRKEMFVKAL
ncbi:hypothetical protein V1514DRAFT_311011 [Lipomyces japonicus]|uniref:uncharacterized protein n=1 Tax=Lipomyces japonicus TaxID=56871 RepID=UPI0034CE0252